MGFILGKKLKMSQIWKDDKVVPITSIQAGPVVVTQIKTKDKDGYEALQVGFETKKKLNKPMKGHLKDLGSFRHIKEFKIQGSEFKIGDSLDVSQFQEGDKVKISGISKGKGFQGVVKRHGFHGRNATHGVKHEQRKPGSIGSSWPEHVIKGRKMPGRMGAERVTVKNLKIVKVDKENNLIAVKGAIPGHRGTLVEIKCFAREGKPGA